MMSTTGRMPVIAAPSPIPVMPASEIGESRTRSVPNSSTSPEVTLKGVPASATSSPMRNTVGSRRSSSASASLTACASEISRVPSCSLGTVTSAGVDMLVDLAGIGERGLERVLGGGRHLCLDVVGDALELALVRETPLDDPGTEEAERIALGLPPLLFVLRAVVGTIDVADVVAVVAVCLADEKAGALAATGTLDGAVGGRVDRARVLPVDFLGRDPERRRPRPDVARGRLREVRVLVVGNVHRAALAAAVALLLAEELAEHTVDRRALRQAVAVAAVGARDVVVT